MKRFFIFWIPAAIRLALIFVGTGILWYKKGPLVGLLAGLIAMTLLVIIQLYYLRRLDMWLDHPGNESPRGVGTWYEIYDRLKQLHRDQEKSQNELREWMTRFREAMMKLPFGIIIVSNSTLLEWCNPTAETHLGLSATNDQGLRITNLIRHPDFIDYLILGQFDKQLPMTINEKHLMLQIIPFENHRQIIITYDITEQEQTARMRRDFIANASHELRTPLTVINGFLEIAETLPDLDEHARKKHLHLMREQGERMQQLIDSMLQLSTLESPDNPLSHTPIAMHALSQKLFEDAQVLSNGQHTITLDINEGPDTLYGNEEEIRTALWNLIKNAIRYTPNGGSIHITWKNTDSGPAFSVKDTGIGIESKHIPRLTQRFYRIDKERSRKIKGSGLGLAIVRHALLRHRAELQIQSEFGVGSEFIALFPKSALIR